MLRSPPILAAALTLFGLGLPACNHDLTCTSEVTQGAGTFRGSASGSQPEIAIRREAMRSACTRLCAAGNAQESCVSRCAVDAEAGKIGARTTCTKGGSR